MRQYVRKRDVALALTLLCVAAGPAAAQDGGLPTLAGRGVGWISSSGAWQVDFSGQLDIETYVPQDSPPWLIPTVDPFVAGRLRLFTDIFAGDHVYALVELRADRGEAPTDASVEARLEQAFVRLMPWPRASVQLQAGKFALPFGGYARRHHAIDDPFIRPPLAYDYRTLVAPATVPRGQTGFLGWKNEAPERRPEGAPPVWNVPYPWGGMLSASVGPLAMRAALASAAASSASEEWGLDGDRLQSPSFTLGADYQLVPELRLGLAWTRGPYLADIETGNLPQGTSESDFVQELLSAEAVFERGRTTVRGEVFLDRWEVPNLDDDPVDVAWYAETRYDLTAGLFVAARWNEMRFNDLPLGDTKEAWDHDVRRIQIGAGYRIVQNSGVRAEYALSRTDGIDPRDDLFALQWWWQF